MATDERSQLVVSVDAGPNGVLFGPVGELDLVTGPVLLSEAEAVSDPARPFSVDLSGLTFLDAAGLSTLLRLRALRQAGTIVTLHRPSAMARRILEITGLVDVFSLDPAERPGS